MSQCARQLRADADDLLRCNATVGNLGERGGERELVGGGERKRVRERERERERETERERDRDRDRQI